MIFYGLDVIAILLLLVIMFVIIKASHGKKK